jgi:hypothetical protein
MAAISDHGSFLAGRENKNIYGETRKYVRECRIHFQSVFFVSIINKKCPLVGALLRTY